MEEITLESLAARVAALEKQLAEGHSPSRVAPRRKDWRSVVGTMEDNEFTRAMLAEIEAAADAERLEAQNESTE